MVADKEEHTRAINLLIRERMIIEAIRVETAKEALAKKREIQAIDRAIRKLRK